MSAIDLKQLLSAIDRNDKDFYNKLSDEQKKEFSPWMVMRWCSSVKGANAEHYLLYTNDLVNHDFSLLNNHPELQWKLISLCGSGRNEYHEWIKPPRRKGKNKIQEHLSLLYPTANNDELAVLENAGKDELVSLFKSAGYNDKEIKDVFKSNGK